MPQSTCYYDGACGLCRASIGALKAIDWLGRIRAEDLTELPDHKLPVSRQQAIESVTLTTPDGRVLRGIRAVRAALLRTPLGALPGLLLYIPGISHAADAAYKWVSANRTRDEPPHTIGAPRD